MKFLRFLYLIIREGSLQHTPFNFEEERRKVLNQLPQSKSIELFSYKKIIKLKVRQSKIAYSLLANLSYLRHARKMNVMLFVSAQKQLIYIRILKSASTSLLKEFLPIIDTKLDGYSLSNEQIDALAFNYVKRKQSPIDDHYQLFSLVRNPFHRIVSVYLDLFNPLSTYFTYESYWFGILNRSMSFREFINIISQVPDSLKGPHFASQCYILSNTTELNHISCFRIDKDQESLHQFLTTYGIHLSHQNKKESTYNFMTFYDLEVLNKVYKMYKQDVIQFEYQFEYNQLLSLVSHSTLNDSRR